MFSSFPTFLSFLRLLQHLVSTKSSSNLLKSALWNPLLEIPLNKAVEPVRKQVLNAAQMILYMIDNDVNYCNMLFYCV